MGRVFAILPIIFCLITYLVLYLAFVPSFSPVISVVGMFSQITNPIIQQSTIIFCARVRKTPTLPTIYKKIQTVRKKLMLKRPPFSTPNYRNLFGELIINDCNVDANFFRWQWCCAQNGVAFLCWKVLSPVTAERPSMLPGHNSTLFSTVKTRRSVKRLEIETGYGNTSAKSPTYCQKRLTEPSLRTFRADYENLMCHVRFDSIGTAQDILYCANLV